MKAIFKRELRSYFTGVIGYVFLVLYLALGGAVFCFTTLYSWSANVTPFYLVMMILSGVALPLLTMKSFSEERKLKTEQLLLTSPVSILGMVLGKFFAAYVIFAGAMIWNSLYFLILIPYGTVKIPLLIGNLLALLLVGFVFIAIGLFVSSLTENQLTAAIGTMGIILAFLLIGLLSSLLPTNFWLRYILDFISIFSRFQGFSNGYFDIASIMYYISLGSIFMYLTVRVFDKRRYA